MTAKVLACLETTELTVTTLGESWDCWAGPILQEAVWTLGPMAVLLKLPQPWGWNFANPWGLLQPAMQQASSQGETQQCVVATRNCQVLQLPLQLGSVRDWPFACILLVTPLQAVTL